MKKIILVFIKALFISGMAFGQDCDLEIPSGSWSGETTEGTGGIYASDDVAITSTSQSIEVSDFSAGFFAAFGDAADLEKTISFTCEGELLSQEFSSPYGTIQLTSGAWDATNQTIEINWEVPGSQISETTRLTYSAQ